MPLHLIRNDITKVKADAIVNTANPYPVIGGGTDTAVYRAAGEEKLLAARKKIGMIAEGDAALSRAYGLDAKYIIHTVSPYWEEGKDCVGLLRSCYVKSLELARKHRCESIAFPLLASGSNRFPKDIALQTALSTIQSYLFEHEMEVFLVVFDKASFRLSEKLFSGVKSYIEEHQVTERERDEYAPRRREKPPLHHNISMPLSVGQYREEREEAPAEAPMYDAQIFLPKKEKTFQVRLLELIDASGESDPAVYKRANLDRKLFAKIRKDENYKPSRKTAAALALALRLSLDDAADLLSRAGIALSPSSSFDLILRYCFEHGIYDIMEVNAILFEFDQETL